MNSTLSVGDTEFSCNDGTFLLTMIL